MFRDYITEATFCIISAKLPMAIYTKNVKNYFKDVAFICIYINTEVQY